MKAQAGAAARSASTEPLQHRLDASGLTHRLFAVDARSAAALGAAIVVLVGAPLAAALNIWIDEAFTLRTTGAGPLEAWARAITFEAQPPLFFVVEAAWRTLNETSIAFARLPSVGFAAGAVALTVFAAARIAPRVPPLAVAAASALNPLIIWAAVEMRVYALVLLIGAGLTWMFYEAFLCERASLRSRVWYVFFALAGLYSQYYVGFVLVAHGLTVLALRRSVVGAFALAAAAITVGFAPFLPVALLHAHASGGFVVHVTFVHALRQIADAVLVVLFPHADEWSGSLKIAGSFLAAVLLVALPVFGRASIPAEPARGVVVQWLMSLAIFSVLFTAAGVPPIPTKYLIVIGPSTLLAGFLFVSSLKRFPALGAGAAAVVYAFFTITALWMQYRPPLQKPGDWQRLAAAVSGGGGSIPVAVFPAELAQPLSWYYPGATVAIPGPMPFTLDYVGAMALPNSAEVARVLDPIRARSEQLWMVTTDDCQQGPPALYDYHCRYLEAYLNRRYRIVRSVAFRGSLARLYARTRD